MFLNLFAQGCTVLFLAPFLFNAFLIVSVSPLLMLSESRQGLAIEVGLSHMLYKAGGISDELSLDCVNDGALMLASESVATDDLKER